VPHTYRHAEVVESQLLAETDRVVRLKILGMPEVHTPGLEVGLMTVNVVGNPIGGHLGQADASDARVMSGMVLGEEDHHWPEVLHHGGVPPRVDVEGARGQRCSDLLRWGSLLALHRRRGRLVSSTHDL